MSTPNPSDDDGGLAEVRAAFADPAFPTLPPGPPASGNVICAECWIKWLKEGHLWQGERVQVVTIWDGTALCRVHLLERVGD